MAPVWAREKKKQSRRDEISLAQDESPGLVERIEPGTAARRGLPRFSTPTTLTGQQGFNSAQWKPGPSLRDLVGLTLLSQR